MADDHPGDEKTSRVRPLWIVLILVGAVAVIAGGATAVVNGGRQALEPQSAAEERCARFTPSSGVADTPEWDQCVRTEVARTPFDVAAPWIGLGVGGLVLCSVASVAAVRGRRMSTAAAG
jgi:hypothetical protein